jgi:hypothetical protein
MKIIPAIAAEKSAPKSVILAQRKVVCVILDMDDMDSLQDSNALTINLEDLFPEISERVSVALCYHNNAEEASRIFKEAYDLLYLDGRKV